MNIRELLLDINDFLTRIEDSSHGEESKEIAELRNKINNTLKNEQLDRDESYYIPGLKGSSL